MSCDPQGQIWDQSKGQKVIASKHAYSGNFLTDMESLGNFLQNGTKFVPPSGLWRYCNLKYGGHSLFFAKTTILEETYLQNYSFDFNKIEIFCFFM